MVRIYVAIGGLLAAVLLAAFVGPAFIDWTQYRERFEAEASRILGREVRVGGEATARLLPFPSVTFEDVVIAEVGGVSLDVERFEMDLELAPFLRGEYLIFDMRMVSPRLQIALDRDGVLPRSETTRQLDGDAISIERLAIVNGIVRLVTPERTVRADDVDMVLRADRLLGPWTGNGAFTIEDQRLAASLTTGRFRAEENALRVLLNLNSDGLPIPVGLAGDLAVENGVPRYAGELTATRTNETPIVLTGKFEAGPSNIAVEEYRMAIGQRDDPYVIVGSAALDTGAEPRFDLQLRGQRLETERIAPDALPEGPTLAERFDALERLAAGLPRLPIDGVVDISLPAIVLPQGVGQNVRLAARAQNGAWSVTEASILLPGRTRVETSGELKLADGLTYDGEIVAVSRQPTGFATWLGNPVDEALRATGQLGVSGDLTLSRDLQLIENLRLVLGDQTLTGRYEANADKTAVALNATAVDLDRARSVVRAVFGPDPIGQRELAFDLAAERAQLDGVQARDIEAKGVIEPAFVEFASLKIGNVADARVEASGTYGLEEGTETTLAVSFGAPAPEPFLALVSDRIGGDWTHALREHAASLEGLEGQAELVWIDPQTSIGFEATGEGGGLNWTAGGSLVAEGAGEQSPVEVSTTTVSVEGPLTSLIRASGLAETNASSPRTVSLDAEYERTPEGHRADLALTSDGDTAAVTVLTGKDGGFVRTQTQLQSLAPYAEALGSPLADRLDVAVDGLIDASNDGSFWTVQIEELQLDDTLLTGRLVGSGWRWQGNVDAGEVPLAWIVTLPLGSTEGDTFASSPLPPIDMLLSVQARVADLPFDRTAEETTMQVRLTRDAVSVENFTGKLDEGTLAGNVSVRNGANGVLLSAAGSLEDGDLTLLPEKVRQALTGGRVSAEASLEATGADVSELISAATGAGTFTLEDPVINNLDPFALPRLYERIDALDEPPSEDIVRDAVVAEAFSERVEPDDIVANASLGGGALRITVPPVSEDGTILSGRGRFDLSEQELDATVDVTFAVPDSRGDGGNPAIRIAFSDVLGDREREIDVGPLTGFLNLRAFEIEQDRVAALRASLLERQRLRRESLLFNAEALEEQREAAAEQARMEAEAAEAAATVRQSAPPPPQLDFRALGQDF